MIVHLRIWHSFYPEILQNLDGKEGNDLLPLPNTKELPYVKSLIELSKKDPINHPVLFCFCGGKLSAKQKQLFEDLHKEAKQQGGKLFVLDVYDYFVCKCQEFDQRIEQRGERRSQNVEYKTVGGNFYVRIDGHYKGKFIDSQRVEILKRSERILSKIKAKYPSDCFNKNISGLLYTDFDCNPEEHINKIKKNPEDEFVNLSIAFQEGMTDPSKDLCPQILYRPLQKSKLVMTEMFIQGLYTDFNNAYTAVIKSSNLQKAIKEAIDGRDASSMFDILDKNLEDYYQNNKIRFLEKETTYNHKTWTKDIETVILEDYKKQISTKIDLVQQSQGFYSKGL